MKKQKKNISVDMSIVTPWRQYRDILPIVLDHTYISAIKKSKRERRLACNVQEIWKRQCMHCSRDMETPTKRADTCIVQEI